MLTLHPITSGIRDGRHQHYPTPNLEAGTVSSEAAAEEAAVRMLSAYGAVNFLQLTDVSGAKVRTYYRGDFFQPTSPLRDARLRVHAAAVQCDGRL